MKTQGIENWEEKDEIRGIYFPQQENEEWEKKWIELKENNGLMEDFENVNEEKIYNFIRQTLAAEHHRIKEIVEGMKIDVPNISVQDWQSRGWEAVKATEWNDALSSVLKELEK